MLMTGGYETNAGWWNRSSVSSCAFDAVAGKGLEQTVHGGLARQRALERQGDQISSIMRGWPTRLASSRVEENAALFTQGGFGPAQPACHPRIGFVLGRPPAQPPARALMFPMLTYWTTRRKTRLSINQFGPGLPNPFRDHHSVRR
jgi:hypothetical protein